ncbi:UNVERIFIED_CONTAM: hypothetical protein Slati_1319000 [Sesamum latifolium]|uniref:Uncharacterized protein n=1 Tax=Sesamum latifolium TaxID=2727402 RepID=A0AAW2XH73_9LAMI
MATFNGNQIGRFIDVDMDGAGQVWGSSMRIRVSVDVTKPLKRVLKIHATLGDEQLLSFSYERLPNFCYLCSCLGHLSKFCEMRFADNFIDPGDATPFGPWLRATNVTTGRVKSIPGSTKIPTPRYSSSPRTSNSDSPQHTTQRPTIRGSSIFGVFPSPACLLTHSPALNISSPTSPTTSPLPPALANCFSHIVHNIELPSYPNIPHALTFHAPILPKPTLTHPTLIKIPDPTPSLSSLLSSPCSFLLYMRTPITLPLHPLALPSNQKRQPLAKRYPSPENRRRLRGSPPSSMILISWNCQGLGTPCTVHTLGELLRAHRPSLVFLAETKCKKDRIESIKCRFDLFGFCVEPQGRSGGLVLLWDKSVSVQLQNFGPHHIDVSIQSEIESEIWRFTGFDGFANTSQRKHSWDLLTHLKRMSQWAWLIAGDYNKILSHEEKKGGRQRLLWQIKRFREALASNELYDLGFEGTPFSWCNQHPEPDTIYERLDRACADPVWRGRFPNATVSHIPVTSSDHAALLIDTDT